MMFTRISVLTLLAAALFAAPAYAVDSDGDGVDDIIDNCTNVSNADQTDTNGDNIGNACDPDVTGPGGLEDCVINFLDLTRMAEVFFTSDPDLDMTGPAGVPDGIVNFLDLNVMADLFFGPPGPSAAGCDAATNEPGTIALSGTTVVGQVLTATVTDANGTGVINYQWQADGVDIAGETQQTLTLTTDQRGAIVSVTANYTDNDGFAEGPLTDTATDIVYSFIVSGESTLLAAAGAAIDGDIIGLASASGGDDYADMAEILLAADNLQIIRTPDSTAVISGATCMAFTGDGIVIDGLVFDDLDWIGLSTCDSQGDGSVFIGGDASSLINSQFLGEAEPRTVPGGDAYHYITLKGVGNLIERNLFTGKDMDNEGSIISIFADPNDAPDFTPSNEDHTIQYNLFKDILGKSGIAGNRDSTAHALQIGRSTGNDSTGDGLITVQYNRFENVQSERRIMRVQSGGNLIQGNTLISTLGMIALEDGYANTVTKNIILSAGDDSDDGGISFAPLGHTVTDNYINNMRTTSSQRAALLLNSDPLSGSGNTALIATPPGDFTVTVARNTIVNARQAIQFEDADCADLPPLLDFDDNFIMNQTSVPSINGNTNGSSRDVVTDDDWTAALCALDAGSTFAGNHFYSAALSTSLTFDFNGNLAGNTVGGQDDATFTQDGNVQPFATGGLVNGSGPDAGVGVDTSTLILIEESQVGPGSTYTVPGSTFSNLVNADRQAYTEVENRTLDSDGDGAGLGTYDLIRALGGTNSIEAPDLYPVNHPGTPHIYEAFDAEVGNHFVFVIHRDIDIDRDRLDITDRQRNEIKTYGQSEDAVKGFEDETMAFQWKFRINPDMEVSQNFSHFFQLKAVGGDDSQPVVSLTGNERSGEDGIEIRQSPLQEFDVLGRVDWNQVTGEWVEVYCRATFSDQGSLRLIAARLSDQEILFDISEQNIDMWRGDSADDFVRPKWGIYRSLLDIANLRPEEENVRFANFSISKLQPVGS